MTNFNDQLHEDLFDLFIMSHYMCVERISEASFIYCKSNDQAYDLVKGLLGQEIHPEQYEYYVDDSGLWDLENGKSAFVYPEAFKSLGKQKKITITLEQV